MKFFENIIETELDVAENKSFIKFTKAALDPLTDVTYKGLLKFNPTLAKDLDILLKTRSISTINNLDAFVNALKVGSLNQAGMGDMITGILKTKGISGDTIRTVTPMWVADKRFIKAWAKVKLTEKALMGKGYSQEAAKEIIRAAKDSVKFQAAVAAAKGTSTVNKSAAATVNQQIGKGSFKEKMWARVKPILLAKVTIGSMVVVGGFIILGTDFINKNTSDPRMKAILDEVKRLYPDCVLKLFERLENTLTLHFNDDGDVWFVYLVKTGIEEYDSIGGLKFFPNGTVTSGDNTKKGSFSCKEIEQIEEKLSLHNTLKLLFEQESEISTKDLSRLLSRTITNLFGWVGSKNLENVRDVLQLISTKTYKGQPALPQFLVFFERKKKRELYDVVQNIGEKTIGLDGMEYKDEILKLLMSVEGGGSSDVSDLGDVIITWDDQTDTVSSNEPTQNRGMVYTQCSDFPLKFGCRNEAIKEIQTCFEFPEKYRTGNFGPITKDTLLKIGYDVEGGITKEIYDDIMLKCGRGERVAATDRRTNQMPPMPNRPTETPQLVSNQTPPMPDRLDTPEDTPELIYAKYNTQKQLSFNENRNRINFRGEKIPSKDLLKLDEYFERYGYKRISEINRNDKYKYKWKKE